jgi:hypothetical protein
VRPEPKEKTVPGEIPAATTITEHELELNAFQIFEDGKSRSAELRAEPRAAGQVMGLPEQAAVEEAVFKVKNYRRIRDTKAVCV